MNSQLGLSAQELDSYRSENDRLHDLSDVAAREFATTSLELEQSRADAAERERLITSITAIRTQQEQDIELYQKQQLADQATIEKLQLQLEVSRRQTVNAHAVYRQLTQTIVAAQCVPPQEAAPSAGSSTQLYGWSCVVCT